MLVTFYISFLPLSIKDLIFYCLPVLDPLVLVALLVIVSLALLGVDGLVGGLAMTLMAVLCVRLGRGSGQSKSGEEHGKNGEGLHFG